MGNNFVTIKLRNITPQNHKEETHWFFLKQSQPGIYRASAREWHHMNMAAREMHWQGPAVIVNEQCQKEAAEKWNASGEEKSMYTSWGKLFAIHRSSHVLHTWQAKAGSTLIKGTKRPSVSLHANERQPLRGENPFKWAKTASCPLPRPQIANRKKKKNSLEPRLEKCTDL